MGIEAKPPVRRGPGVGSVVLAALIGVLVCGSVLFGLSLVGLRMLGRSDTQHVASADHGMSGAAGEGTMSADFAARLTAAKRIYATSDRDEALRTLASNSAENSYEAISAIGEIRTNQDRDWAAWDVARRFSETKQSHHAIAVVELISDRSLSDAASMAIATGDWPDAPGSRYVSDLNATVTEAAAAEGFAH